MRVAFVRSADQFPRALRKNLGELVDEKISDLLRQSFDPGNVFQYFRHFPSEVAALRNHLRDGFDQFPAEEGKKTTDERFFDAGNRGNEYSQTPDPLHRVGNVGYDAFN